MPLLCGEAGDGSRIPGKNPPSFHDVWSRRFGVEMMMMSSGSVEVGGLEMWGVSHHNSAPYSVIVFPTELDVVIVSGVRLDCRLGCHGNPIRRAYEP